MKLQNEGKSDEAKAPFEDAVVRERSGPTASVPKDQPVLREFGGTSIKSKILDITSVTTNLVYVGAIVVVGALSFFAYRELTAKKAPTYTVTAPARKEAASPAPVVASPVVSPTASAATALVTTTLAAAATATMPCSGSGSAQPPVPAAAASGVLVIQHPVPCGVTPVATSLTPGAAGSAASGPAGAGSAPSITRESLVSGAKSVISQATPTALSTVMPIIGQVADGVAQLQKKAGDALASNKEQEEEPAPPKPKPKRRQQPVRKPVVTDEYLAVSVIDINADRVVVSDPNRANSKITVGVGGTLPGGSTFIGFDTTSRMMRTNQGDFSIP